MTIQEELERLGIKPVQGQNFLESEPVIQALVEAGEPDDQHVVEIGGGTGAITERLAGRAGEVTVVERNTVLAEHLEEKFPGIEVLNEDFLDLELEGYDRCIANIPFQISKQVLEKLGEAQLQSSLIVQEELAEKIVAEPGSKRYSETTVRINYYFIPVKLRTISSKNFYPEPDVDAAILKLYPNRERHGVEKEEEFFQVVKALFTHKRKKVRNAFVDVRHMLEIDKEEAKKVRDQVPNSEKRVNELEIIDLKQIAEFIREKFNSA